MAGNPYAPGLHQRASALAGGTGAPPAGEASARGLLRGDRLRFETDAQRLRNTCAIGGIGLGTIGDMTLLDVLRSAADLPGGVVEQILLLLRIYLPGQVARLLPMVVIDPVIPVSGCATELERGLVELRLIDPIAPAVREVGRSSAEVAVRAHGAVAMIALERAFRRVDRDVMVIDAQAITLRVPIREQAPLQHLVGRKADTRHDVGG